MAFVQRDDRVEQLAPATADPALGDAVYRTTVSGFTMSSTSDHRGHRCRRVVQKKRSKRVNVGRGRWRLSTATCCRSARTSRAVSLRLQTNTRSAARIENTNSSMTRPCFITWCRWNQPTAPDRNLLILKHDVALAPHRRSRPACRQVDREEHGKSLQTATGPDVNVEE